MTTGRLLDVAPDPLGLARRLAAAGLPDRALLFDASGGVSWLAACADAVSTAIDPDRARTRLRRRFGDAPRWIGVLPYESFRDVEREDWRKPDTRPDPITHRIMWRRYPAVIRIDPRRGEVMVIGDAVHVRALSGAIAEDAAVDRRASRVCRPPSRCRVTSLARRTWHASPGRAS